MATSDPGFFYFVTLSGIQRAFGREARGVRDEVVVLEDGGAVQRGAHAELLRTAGPYARMWARESEGL